jgi:hypothetical protein
MKIGMITDSLGAPSFDQLLGTAAEFGIEKRRKLGVLQPWPAKP